eukprot:UC4_evm1s898
MPGRDAFMVQKRYSEFDQLTKDLNTAMNRPRSKRFKLSAPSRTLGKHNTPEVVAKRKRAIEGFFVEVNADFRSISLTKPFLDFFEIAMT